ncbi:MAG TPA: lipid-A-disaccharide synthase [Usitatibacteraceae bacterium]|nr:lipid-A-disaccharide synthase [Usitatibacteraceae bacterium]
MGRRIAIVAGEASGDMLGAALVSAVRERFPGTEFYGIAGPRMMAAGATTLVPMEKLSVRGYVEALRSLPELLRIRSSLAARLVRERPDLFIGIDAPDFNLGLEAKLKRAGIPTVHYVSPSIWAWRAGRLPAIGRAVDRVLTIFPFEAPLYEKAGIAATYVGHPLADQIPLVPDRADARAQLRLADSATAVALLPGSRRGELQAHADLFIDTALRLAARRPGIRFFVPLATRETRDWFETRLYAREAQELDLTILFGHARLALQAADCALVASGTATLEGALARCPMVITYKVPALTYRLMMRKPLLPYVGLPNILAGEFIVPELLQDHATPENLEQALGNWLDHKTARERLLERYDAIHAQLRCGNDERVAQALSPWLTNGSPHASQAPAREPELAALRGR